MQKISKQSDRPEAKSEMELLRKQKIEHRLKEIPKQYRGIYKKAVETNSKTAAIHAFCLECVCWQKDEIINCTAVICPLYSVRPFVETRKNTKNKRILPTCPERHVVSLVEPSRRGRRS
ncbi:MAG: hypothetical protein A2173_11925 [Planctomycetes bacterium RBG_13_44_8b]|nr:MAG: hypothetical protein A2173_11925 [Planctomycetes bacterium RBG_13_44_8b]